ncbi:hypothetical protein JTB14_028204 [Gonioctena quinquepunctata]|nr:hypothetical protein JTB14_028204 [Gonioctena quinquepunctata]
MILNLIVLGHYIKISHSILLEENGKFLNHDFQDENLGRRRRPSSGSSSGCNFNGRKGVIYKTDGTGRTFVDLAFLNVGYNYQYNIDCGGAGNGQGDYPSNIGNKPGLGIHKPGQGNHKPGHRPILGSQKPILGGNKPTGTFSESILNLIITLEPY